MRRKSTRGTAKASPEKPKEEKTTKKPRRHSKRHKPTTSESESEGEVSVSSIETATLKDPAEKELWTVTQTETSNDIGKIKICLSRPSPTTPERSSKRLRNKPLVNMEETPVEVEFDEKPTRRSRRRIAGSSPASATKEEAKVVEVEQVEEKKGKGKSKGKHKSKIVEQTSSETEMQSSEISENVQVTAQSPQKDNNAETVVDPTDCKPIEDDSNASVTTTTTTADDTKDVEQQQPSKSPKSPHHDNRDPDHITNNASNKDVSNNNLIETEPSVPLEKTNNDLDESSRKSIDGNEDIEASSQSSTRILEESSDVSMKEVSHFELNETINDSQPEETHQQAEDADNAVKSSEELKPSDDDLKPSNDDLKPSNDDLKPSNDDLKPSDDLKSSKDEAKAPGSNYQSFEDAFKASVSDIKQPVDDKEEAKSDGDIKKGAQNLKQESKESISVLPEEDIKIPVEEKAIVAKSEAITDDKNFENAKVEKPDLKVKTREHKVETKEKDHKIEKDHKSQERDFRSKERDYKSKESDHKSKESDHKTKESDHKSKESDHRSKESDHRSKESDHRSKESDHKSKETDHRSKESDQKLKDTHKLKERDNKSKERDHKSRRDPKSKEKDQKSKEEENKKEREFKVGKTIKVDDKQAQKSHDEKPTESKEEKQRKIIEIKEQSVSKIEEKSAASNEETLKAKDGTKASEETSKVPVKTQRKLDHNTESLDDVSKNEDVLKLQEVEDFKDQEEESVSEEALTSKTQKNKEGVKVTTKEVVKVRELNHNKSVDSHTTDQRINKLENLNNQTQLRGKTQESQKERTQIIERQKEDEESLEIQDEKVHEEMELQQESAASQTKTQTPKSSTAKAPTSKSSETSTKAPEAAASKPAKVVRKHSSLREKEEQFFTLTFPAESTKVRTRDWGSTATSLKGIIEIHSTDMKEMFPDVSLVDEKNLRLDAQRRASYDVARATETRRVTIENFESAAPSENSLAFNRKISIVDDEASSLRPPPSPAKNDVSDVLFITNLVRPFTVKQLRGLLERTGKIKEDAFWTDKVKSKCYVQYENVSEAEATRNALHGVLWPVGNGKKLMIEFATPEDLENAKNPPPPPPPPPPAPVVPVTVAPLQVEGKENLEPVPIRRENDIIKPRDDGFSPRGKDRPVEEQQQRREKTRMRRSSSRDRSLKRRHSKARNSRSPTAEYKKRSRKEEPVPQRAMDDLFKKTEATPSIYWQPLSPEEIAMKQQERQERMEAHKRKIESQTTTNSIKRGGGGGGGGSDFPRGGRYRRRY